MKKVKLLVSTAYQGPRKEGEVISVPDDFAKRWAKNGIAEIVGDVQKEEAPKKEEAQAEVPEEVQEPVADTVDYNSMNAKELYALCKEKGLEVEAKKSKEYYIEQLNA